MIDIMSINTLPFLRDKARCVAGLLMPSGTHADLAEYLQNCVTRDGAFAAGIEILSASKLVEENCEGSVPGGRLINFGFFVLGISIGGNAIAAALDTGQIFWADLCNFSDDHELSYLEPLTGLRSYVPWNSSNVRLALTKLEDSIQLFLEGLSSGRLERLIEQLDE